ncbi:hypothetical protein [Tatumella ptyseos]|uniref:hypothetical protein n=1 Tax=Tatumella ptyseos TaxID=82987 RepID=UPI0026EABD5D|nr:hypothetical protein [Tatumella ptyseos]WKX27761.1 hypothetical protein QJR74_06490 [Tatumella ptyseos]
MTSTASVCCTIGSSNLPIIDVEHDGVLASEFIFYWKGVSAGLSDRPALLQLAKRIIAQRLESL